MQILFQALKSDLHAASLRDYFRKPRRRFKADYDKKIVLEVHFKKNSRHFLCGLFDILME